MSSGMLGQSLAVTRRVGLASANGSSLLVDTYQHASPSMARFATMNPFHFVPEWRIPVPGQPGTTASSLESVWQGLKIVNDRTDLEMFHNRPNKRPPEGERGSGFDYAGSRLMFGEHPVDLVAGRLLIYLPAYLYLLDRLVPQSVVEEILGTLRDGSDVLFFDCDDNFDIFDDRTSFSHSALLAAWFGGRLEADFIRPRAAYLDRADLPHTDAGRDSLATDRYLRIHSLEGAWTQ